MNVRGLFLLWLLASAGCREPTSHAASLTGPSRGGQAAMAPSGGKAPLASALPAASVTPASGEPLSVGQSVKVAARHPSGVPLHPEAESSVVSGRLADGSSVRIEAVREGRWFEVSQGQLRGWVTRRYLVAPRAETGSALPPGSPFASRDACAAALSKQERLPRAAGVARVGSWNLHWFPDTRPGRPAEDGKGTDLEWLACAIAWLDFDVMAAQELKGTPAARARLDELLKLLDRATGGSWQADLDDCPDTNGQHVGVLYDRKRETRLGGATLAALNPHGEPCKDQLRPGLDVYLKFRGGLDLHVVSLHLKAGGKSRDIGLRRRSFSSFSEAWTKAQDIAKDADQLMIGDLNTMGCPDCSPPTTSEAELAELEALMSSEGFRRLPVDRACSFHYQGSGTLLDGASVSSGFREAEGVSARVSGLCAELGCERASERLAAREALSDHCPLYVDLRDEDAD